jgi:hypothetical protein
MRNYFRQLIFPVSWISELNLRGIHLDIGSGTGFFLKMMSACTDYSEGIEVRKKYLKSEYPLVVLEPTKSEYDVITIIDVLHHIPNKLEVLSGTLDSFRPSRVIIKDMSNEKYFPKLMNRVHDFIFGHTDLISEIDERDLCLFMNLKGYKLISSNKTQKFWYNHFIHEYKIL